MFCTLVLANFASVARAEYKPVDTSDIKGNQRKQLSELVGEVRKMPTQSQDGFLCEQLGLCFATDGSKVMWYDKGPRTTASKAFFVGRSGRPLPFAQAYSKGSPVWSKCYDTNIPINQTKPRALLSFFKNDVERVVRNTAKYLMKEMPDDLRWTLLATLDKKLYYQDGRSASEKKHEFSLECGAKFSYYGDWENGYCMGASGEEIKVWEAFRIKEGRWERYRRWSDIVRRCANLVGDKDILALFPEEVKAMRKQYKQRLAQMKEQKDEANKALLAAADEMLASLPNEDLKYAKIAAAIGLYFEDHAKAGYNGSSGGLNPNVTIFLPNGKKLTGGDNLVNGTNPGILQQIPHEAILEHYREPITQMARHIAEDRFKEMPPIVRDLMRAEISGNLINADGSPAQDLGGGYSTVETHNRRTWKVSMVSVDRTKTFFVDSVGRKLPYSIVEQYNSYGQTFRLIHLCTLILGSDEVLEYIPPAGENEEKDLREASRKSAMGSTSPEGVASSGGAQYAEGIAALRRMSTGMRRAWLAENMGFCYTQSNAPAYTAPHIANDNALFVDEQGKERKLSEVATDKMTPDWVAATKAALAVGHEQVAAPFKEELKALAVQTATHILKSIDKTPRYSWLAEMNHLIFNPNGQSAYPPGGQTNSVESGFKVHAPDVNYGGKLYYNPQGKISQPSASNAGWKRWNMLFRCADVAGIEAINAEFKADVEAMRAAYKKSPFYKK